MSNYPPAEPVHTLPLIRKMRTELLQILEGLSTEEWNTPTVCEGWSIRDVAVHILGDDVGILSNLRDSDGQTHEISGWEELVAYINAQNDLWVRAGRRMSRRLLLDLLRSTGEQVYETFAGLDPQEMASPIGWAGSGSDPLWLHIAREYTEYWMHHQHICEAIGKTSLKDARFIKPLISTFMRALPPAYQEVHANEGSQVLVRITGEAESEWRLVREKQEWELYQTSPLEASVEISLDADTAWRLFTRNKDVEELSPGIEITGDEKLGEVFLCAKAYIG
jgi:uncharacterized protein (TIGR03083 family)